MSSDNPFAAPLAGTVNERLTIPQTNSKPGYGWVMVGVGALAMVATLPGRTHGLGMITERLLDDSSLNLSRVGYGQMNLWATLLGALFCLGIGNFIDRFGLRIAAAVTMIPLGLVVIGMTMSTSIVALFVALTFTRGLGQSALSVVSITMVGKWFRKNVSFPMAIYSISLACGFIAIAMIARSFTEVDWRSLWAFIGGCVLVAGVLAVILSRAPSSDDIDAGHRTEPTNQSTNDFSTHEAIRTPIFWVIAFGISLYGLISSGISLFNESILKERGFAVEVYYESMAIGIGVGVLAQLSAGLMGIRVPVSKLVSIALIVLATSLLLLTRLSTYFDVVVYVVVNAVGGGLLTVMFFSAWPQLFGRKNLGKIQGIAQMATVVASAVGPLILAQSKSSFGSYNQAIYVLMVVSLVIAVAAWVVPQPRKIEFEKHTAIAAT